MNFSELNLNLLETEQTNSSKMETVPPRLCTNSSECQNSSCSLVGSNETELSSTQDRELVSILVDLENSEIKVLEKVLDYASIQCKINEPELRNEFEEFCRRMRPKWYFRNDPTSKFSETSSFTSKSSWKPPKGHPSLEAFLNEIEKEIFAIPDLRLGYSNLSREE